MTDSEIACLKAVRGTPLEYMLATDAPLTATPLGEVQVASAISYQVIFSSSSLEKTLQNDTGTATHCCARTVHIILCSEHNPEIMSNNSRQTRPDSAWGKGGLESVTQNLAIFDPRDQSFYMNTMPRYFVSKYKICL